MSPLRTGFLAFVEHTGVDGTRSAGLDGGIRHLEPYLPVVLGGRA